ncbi:pore-forming ESAT-6 family protein [Myceligenerans crystallogenes]|uniref:Pore-forming ESAT-6 family protein n=1 Tax=Myceligenerans crystallogenes TaxID=316335 RepID=A0ABP4ZHR8_9MICO
MANDIERRSFDAGASAEAQANFDRIASQLEALIDQRDADVKSAMAEYQADGVSDEYHAKEQRWNSAATEVRTIIRVVRQALEENDATARRAMQGAKAAVDSIG